MESAEEGERETPRILSLAPNLTEVLFALEAQDLIVGVTDYCRYPSAATALPRVGGLHDVSLERALALDPNLVLHMGTPSPAVQRLRQRGVEVVSVPSETIDEILEGIRVLGRLTGKEERARIVVGGIEGRLNALRNEAATVPSPRVLFVVSHPPGVLREVYTAGPGTFLHELVEIVNGKNIMEGSASPYPMLSREWAMANRPDVIIESRGDGGSWSAEERRNLERLWPEYLGVDASRAPRIVFIDDPRFTVPGPGIAEGAARLFVAIHGPGPGVLDDGR